MSALARLQKKLNADNRAMEIQAERENPMDGKGRTGGAKRNASLEGLKQNAKRDFDADMAHLQELHGAGFMDSLKNFIKKLKPALTIAASLPEDLW